MAILVPATFTNVPQTEGTGVQYVGERVVPLSRSPVALKRASQGPATPEMGRSLSDTASAPADPKRRCTEPAAAAIAAAPPTLHHSDPLPRRPSGSHASPLVCGTGHFIAPAAPMAPIASTATPLFQRTPPGAMHAYPGMVVQHTTPVSSKGAAVEQPAFLGVATPPMLAPSLAGGPLSTADSSSSVDMQQQHFHALQQYPEPEYTMSMAYSDPTMEQYFSRQYAIKAEQAFPCHRVINLNDLQQQQQQSQSVGWAAMLRSLIGRAVSP